MTSAGPCHVIAKLASVSGPGSYLVHHLLCHYPAARQRNHADLCRCVALRLRGDIAVRLARTPARAHATGIRHSSRVLASGLTSYGISYVLTYVAEESIPSGLVAIAYTLMVLTPAIAFFAYRTAVTRREPAQR